MKNRCIYLFIYWV